MGRIIIDTNFLIALIDKRDKWNLKAKALFEEVEKRGWETLYLDCAVNEAVSVLGKRLEQRKESYNFEGMMERFEKLLPKEEIEWIYPNVPVLYDDIMLLIREKSGRFNFHDALITLFMEENNLKYILSFDKDFDEIDWIVRIGDKEVLKAQK